MERIVLDLVIFDLDDTLAWTGHRAYLLSAVPVDWDAYNALCVNDRVIDEVAAVFYDHFVASRDMWIVTARSESVRELTEDWLYKHGLYYNKIVMRAMGDNRASVDVKLRWLHDGTIPKDRVLCAYDNELAVAQMYRDEGITCFHVIHKDL
jgi:hypothetical protein